VLNNVDSRKFGRRQFSISEETSHLKLGGWTDFIDNSEVRKLIEANRGDWVNYVKASVLKIKDEYPDKELKGMDIVALGDIPRGSGMASSSALVVSSGLAFMAINGLAMDRREMVVCMGRGEWYVGTRGGFGDHGAMLFGKRGHILHSVFLTAEEINPEYIPFPNDYQVIVVNSYKTSSKSSERLFAYNQTMFAYNMAMVLIKDALKVMGYDDQLLGEIEYLGQITPEKFGMENIYKMLRLLPEKITIEELKQRYKSDIDKRLNRFFGQLGKIPELIEPRGAALWGIAESERSREFARLIMKDKVKEAGELMYIGHDGDRLFTFDDSGSHREFTDNKVTDEYLNSLIDDLRSGDADRIQKAHLSRQPGDFDASSMELDKIVDIARKTDGIIGASLTGAGFGGNILAIGRRNNEVLDSFKESLFNDYYEPQEQAELEWLENDKDLESAIGNDDEIQEIRRRMKDIVKKKKISRQLEDTEYAESVQKKINSLFREKKIDREMLFISADYYREGVFVNIPVEHAQVL